MIDVEEHIEVEMDFAEAQNRELPEEPESPEQAFHDAEQVQVLGGQVGALTGKVARFDKRLDRMDKRTERVNHREKVVALEEVVLARRLAHAVQRRRVRHGEVEQTAVCNSHLFWGVGAWWFGQG